ncbi:HYP2 [Aspergillus pseudonomiae]
MDVPFVKRTEYQLLNIDDGFLNLMNENGDSKDDVKLPDGELGDRIQTMFDDGKDCNVIILAAMGEECAMDVKEAPKGN